MPLHSQASGSEPFLFPGNILFICTIIGFFFWKNIQTADRYLAKSLLILGVSVTSFGFFTLWWMPMLFVPSVRAVNAAGRIASVLWCLSAFPLSGLILDLERRLVRFWKPGSLFLVACTLPLLWISLLPRSALALDVVAWQKDQDNFRTELLKEGCDVLHLEVNEAFPWHGDVFAMHAMLYVPGLKSVSGYSGWQPRNGWQQGMHARDAFRWALTNLGRNNYKAATSISAADTFCGVRAFSGDTGQAIYELQKFSADEIQGQ